MDKLEVAEKATLIIMSGFHVVLNVQSSKWG